jgi:hypothetical protein
MGGAFRNQVVLRISWTGGIPGRKLHPMDAIIPLYTSKAILHETVRSSTYVCLILRETQTNYVLIASQSSTSRRYGDSAAGI